MERQLGSRARILGADAPGLDPAAGRRWLKLPEHARWLAQLVRSDGGGPATVVGHSLGGLVALRLALDAPDTVAAMLLLDPSPPIFGALLPKPVLALVGAPRAAPQAIRRRLGSGREAATPAPRSVPLRTRIRWYVVGGAALAADVAAGRFPTIPTVLVSADDHDRESAARRIHERLVRWLPDAKLEVWPGTTHAIHPEQPERVVETALALAARASGC